MSNKEMKNALVFGVMREGYGIDQVHNPLTVGDLRCLLEDLDDDITIILSHDNGYTYGSLPSVAELREQSNDDGWTTVEEYLA